MAYRRVLIGTDFSEASLEAARCALVYGGRDARYRVVHVEPPSGPPSWWPTGRDEPAGGAATRREGLLRSLHEWARKAGLPNVEPALPVGSAGKEMAREAAAMGADLVVVGSRGRSKVERLLLGSTARAILRASVADTLVVRGKTGAPDGPGATRILVATDFNEPSRAAAKRALALAQEWNAEVRVVHAVDPTPWSDPMMEPPDGADDPQHLAWVPDALHRFNAEALGGIAKEDLLRGMAVREVPRHAEEVGADLVVVGTHGAGGIERFLLGSVAEGLVERSPCPVLVVHA